VLRSKNFLKFSLAAAYRSLPLSGVESGFQLTKTSLLIGMLSAFVNSKSNTPNRYSLSGRELIKVSHVSSFSPIFYKTFIQIKFTIFSLLILKTRYREGVLRNFKLSNAVRHSSYAAICICGKVYKIKL
jgi:hypothetical protein